jgi:hypothetical protein
MDCLMTPNEIGLLILATFTVVFAVAAPIVAWSGDRAERKMREQYRRL